ncbi:putative assembly of substrate-specific ubiquitin ligase complexes modulator [Scheffersomyces amazonensis]|uniref:putative assembly of substrate-specific ubiquitin ligase complexes modulator n=1 Tax=Scheffersomyces amazonensis TaxID=1078765 RepID=UPI00315CDF19
MTTQIEEIGGTIERRLNEPGVSVDESSESSLKKAFSDLCHACRIGDRDVVEILLSIPNLDINQMDDFNYSPLILSSLCGHMDVVELLLSRGAICDRDTFEGARCIYGALTDEIRDLLISFDISKAVDLDQPFASHVSSLLITSNEVITKDIIFRFGDKYLKLNRFMLSARSPHFQEKIINDWKYKSIIDFPEDNFKSFKVIADYIYVRADGISIGSRENHDEVIRIAKQFQLTDLISSIEQLKDACNTKERTKIMYDISFRLVERARSGLDDFLQKHILGGKLVVEIEIPDEETLEELDCTKYISDVQKKKLLETSAIPDIILASIDYDTESITYYPVNKAIIARSEYFDTMFKSEIFLEANRELPLVSPNKQDEFGDVIKRESLVPDDISIIRISTASASSEVAEMILSFLYHDNILYIPLRLTVELLFVADELFLDRLKTMCAVNISSNFDKFNQEEFFGIEKDVGYNVYDLVRVSWKTRCAKLEHHTSKMLAYNLEHIYEDAKQRKAFSALIKESADRIEERHETDTIELIDDIRYYLSKKYAIGEDFEELDPVRAFMKGEQSIDTVDYKREELRLYKNSRISYERDIDRIDALLDGLQLDA